MRKLSKGFKGLTTLFLCTVLLSVTVLCSRANAAISFVSKTLTPGSGTSATPAEPSGAAADDILFLWIVLDSATSGLNVPAAWTQLNSMTGASSNMYLYYTRRGSSAPSYSLSWSGNWSYEISVTAWRGVAATGFPIDVRANNTPTSRNPGNPNCPSVTTTVTNTEVIAFGMNWNGWPTTASAPAGYNLREGGVNGDVNRIAVASKAVATITAEDPGAFSGASGSGDVGEITVALRPADAPISFVNKTFAYNANTTSVNPGEPAGVAEGDILFLWVVVQGNNSSFNPPTGGWNLLYALPATSADVWLYWIRRGSSAPSYTSTWTTSGYNEASVTAWRGALASGDPINVKSFNARTTRNPANPNCPSVTTTVANTQVIAFAMQWTGWNTGGATTPSGYALRESGGLAMDLAVASIFKASAGAEDPGAFANAQSGSNEVAEITIALAQTVAPVQRVRHRVVND